MSKKIDSYIKSALTLDRSIARNNNSPSQYSDQLNPYLYAESTAFVHQYAKYASDFFTVESQGLNPNDFFDWVSTRARMSDTSTATAATTKLVDDFKMILFENPSILYFPIGAKLKAMGSVWISVNPQNISAPTGSGLVQRCNSVWNHLDFYGNILSEPICLMKAAEMANENDEQRLTLITKGYMDVLCQYNSETKQLNQNSRLILGSSAFSITGYTDYVQEFTGDYNSVHLLRFTVRYMEPNETDDMVNHVAGGKLFSWKILIDGTPTIATGTKTIFTASSIRRGESVVATSENPISYIWESSDESIATVDSNGTVTAISPGTCTITATLAQNKKISSSALISTYISTYLQDSEGEYILDSSGEKIETVLSDQQPPAISELKFTTEPPTALSMFDSATLSVALYSDGVPQDAEISWDLSGAPKESYKFLIPNQNSIKITCFRGSETQLQIKASTGEKAITTAIRLIGM